MCLCLNGDVVHVTMLCFDFIPTGERERTFSDNLKWARALTAEAQQKYSCWCYSE